MFEIEEEEENKELARLRLRCEVTRAHIKMVEHNNNPENKKIDIDESLDYQRGFFDDRDEAGLIQYIKAYNFLTMINQKFQN